MSEPDFSEQLDHAFLIFMFIFGVISTTMMLVGIGRHNVDLGFWSGAVALMFWVIVAVRVQD